MNVFFGFGHGFGGTHLLANLLNIPPNVDCKHERKSNKSKYSLFDKYMDVFHNKNNGVSDVKNERTGMVKSVVNSGKVFGEINGILGFFIEALHNIWPRSKLIYIMRDPRTQVLSAYNTGIFDKKVEQVILSSHPDWDSVWWWPYPSSNDSINKDFSFLSAFEKCAWFWSSYNEFVLSKLENVPTNKVFYLKFEDMIKGNKIMELYDFLELQKPNKKQINDIVSIKHAKTVSRAENPLPKWEQLKPNLQKRLLEFTEETMIKLGYEVKR